MPEKILRAVANPATLFWAPQLPAGINMAVHAFFIIYGWGIFRMSPLIFIASFFICHIVIASQGVREPHLSTMIRAWLFGRRRTRNLNPGRTKKFVS
ncbi:MAG: hypothetical protein ACK5UY_05325 [Holosporales bacterium]|jgi:hypothetical protein